MTVPAGSGGLLMLPYLLGERAPRWGGAARGAYVGLTRAHQRAHLVRAAVEGVALQLTLVLRSMRGAGLDISEIRATGGVMKHEMWRRTLASAFDASIGFPASPEGSGFGAALLGMEALGIIESMSRLTWCPSRTRRIRMPARRASTKSSAPCSRISTTPCCRPTPRSPSSARGCRWHMRTEPRAARGRGPNPDERRFCSALDERGEVPQR